MVPVWAIDLDDPRALRGDGVESLSVDERERARRFRFDKMRARWLAGRVALRRILARELRVRPEEVEYRVLEHGKPALAGPHAAALEFNLSHSGACGLVGTSREVPLGVDVEEVTPIDDIRAVAERHFAPEECECLFALEGAAQVEGFYRYWTRKEAYIKALGTGLGHALDRFAVTQEPDDCRFLHLDGDAAAARGWTLAHLRPSDALDGAGERRFVGAVALPIAAARVELRRFSWST